MRTSLPGTMSAATIGNAAEEISPGTVIRCGVNSASPRIEITRDVPTASTSIAAPKPRSIRSLWSRVGTSSMTRVTPGVFQTSRDGSRVFFVERESEQQSPNARNVFVLTNDGEKEAVISARSGRLETQDDGRWLVLESGQRNETDLTTGNRTLSRFETYRVLADERSVQRAGEQPPRATRTVDLMNNPTLKNQAELAWRFGLLLGAGNLLLLGIGLASTNPRRASNWNLLFALLGFIVYYNLINLSQAWIASGRLSLGASLLALHGTMFGVGLALLWWRDHGTTLRWRGKRRAVA